MSTGVRIETGVVRPEPLSIVVNGTAVTAYEGETVATALLAAGTVVMSFDFGGRARSPYCNMGMCFDCIVTIVDARATTGQQRRVRACLEPVRAGMLVSVPAR